MRIAVVGAGLGGVAVAAGLHRAGHAVTLFERGAELREKGTGIAIMPNGRLHALDALELAEDVRGRHTEAFSGGLRDWRGRPLLVTDVIEAQQEVGSVVIVELWCEEQVRTWTNRRVRARQAGNLPPGPESSIGKVHGTDLNQRIQELAATLTGEDAIAWPGTATTPAEYWASMPAETRGMLRSRANTIEGGTTEVNKNVIAERVLDLPKDFDPYRGKPWRDLPRS